MIYFDNAATTVHKPKQVIDAVGIAMATMGNAARGAYESALNASREVYNARVKVARFFNCKRPENVIFTANSTEALNIAINGTVDAFDNVISTDCEHNSVLRPLYRLESEHRVKLSFVRANRWGDINCDHFEKLICRNTKAIVCTHASNLTGNLFYIEAIGKIARKNNVLFIVDASQTAGVIPIDMEKMNVDILCFTGHKGLMGPQGTGGMCIREGVEVSPLLTGGTGIQSYSRFQPLEYPARLEAGTVNAHGIAGLSSAIDFLNETGLGCIHEKESELMWRFYNGIVGIDGVKVYGNFSMKQRCAIVSLNIRDYDSASVSDELSEKYRIATRPGAHCAPRMHEALKTDGRGAVRFSFGFYNTEDEVDYAIRAVREIAEG